MEGELEVIMSSMILFNPDDGAVISDVTFEGVVYFKEKSFDPGGLYKFEDEKTAEFFLDIFQFLERVSIEKAKKIMSEPKLKCEKCNFETRNKASLTIHFKKHQAEAELDELGIPVVKQTGNQKAAQNMLKNDIQKEIEQQENNFRDGYPGLTEGEGLTRENMQPGAVMS